MAFVQGRVLRQTNTQHTLVCLELTVFILSALLLAVLVKLAAGSTTHGLLSVNNARRENAVFFF